MRIVGINSSPSVAPNGTVYVVAEGGLYSISPGGTIQWRLQGPVTGSVAVGVDGTIYVAGAELSEGAFTPLGRVWAVTPRGRLKWISSARDMLFSAPTVSTNGTVYVAGWQHTLYALDESGKTEWVFDGRRPKLSGESLGMLSSPAVGPDGTVYVGSGDGNLYAITSTGAERWRFSTKTALWTSPTVDSKGVVYIGDGAGRLHALDRTGVEEWSLDTKSRGAFDPLVGADGTIYVASLKGLLYALAPEDGTVRWTFRLGGGVGVGGAVLAKDRIYCGTMNGKLVAASTSGKQRWRVRAGGNDQQGPAWVLTPAIGPDGTLYYGVMGGALHAVGDRRD